MRINPIKSQNVDYKSNQVVRTNSVEKTKSREMDSVAFTSRPYTKAAQIEKSLAQYGMRCEFNNNTYVAEAVEKTVGLFRCLFSRDKLPPNVNFRPLPYGVLGTCNPIEGDEVAFNSNERCFTSSEQMKRQVKNSRRLLLPSDISSKHEAHVFVHEFSHRAHWRHLEENNGYTNARRVWEGLAGTGVPTAIGRLVTRFKLSNYAVDGQDMCEFMAERMTQDICRASRESDWAPDKVVDVRYHNIFDRKWEYRFSSPQSYLDYFTQQVWNGNITMAKEVGKWTEDYLAELDNVAVKPKIVEKIERETQGIPILEKFGNLLGSLGEAFTENANKRNKITLNKKY